MVHHFPDSAWSPKMVYALRNAISSSPKALQWERARILTMKVLWNFLPVGLYELHWDFLFLYIYNAWNVVSSTIKSWLHVEWQEYSTQPLSLWYTRHILCVTSLDTWSCMKLDNKHAPSHSSSLIIQSHHNMLSCTPTLSKLLNQFLSTNNVIAKPMTSSNFSVWYCWRLHERVPVFLFYKSRRGWRMPNLIF